MDFTGKWIFIRFNPDKYWDSENKRRNPRMKKRLDILLKEINKHIERILCDDNEELIEIFHLYFDEF